MKDPVNNFEIPPEWIKRAALPEDELSAGISNGRLVLLADGSVLRRGYTTGTTAAAAAKAAVLSLKRTIEQIDHVTVPTPAGIGVTLPVSASAAGHLRSRTAAITGSMSQVGSRSWHKRMNRAVLMWVIASRLQQAGASGLRGGCLRSIRRR